MAYKQLYEGVNDAQQTKQATPICQATVLITSSYKYSLLWVILLDLFYRERGSRYMLIWKQYFHHHSHWLMIMTQNYKFVSWALCLTFGAFVLMLNKVMCLSIISLPLEKGLILPWHSEKLHSATCLAWTTFRNQHWFSDEII